MKPLRARARAQEEEADEEKTGEDGDGEELSQSQRLAFNQDDRPSTGRTSSFALAPSRQ